MLLKTLISSFSLVATGALAACASSTTPSAGHWTQSTAGGGRVTGMVWQPDQPASAQSAMQSMEPKSNAAKSHLVPNTAAGGRVLGMVSVQD